MLKDINFMERYTKQLALITYNNGDRKIVSNKEIEDEIKKQGLSDDVLRVCEIYFLNTKLKNPFSDLSRSYILRLLRKM